MEDVDECTEDDDARLILFSQTAQLWLYTYCVILLTVTAAEGGGAKPILRERAMQVRG